MTISGIHQVPIDQKNSVNPFRKGSVFWINDQFCAFNIKLEPANVVIATAPILIQYAGANSSARISKNDIL